jgi:16S rRNA (cytidine1402-2'-O)-methyltransferase
MSGISLVTLPIGNDDDITINALNCLKRVDTIYCEDTRVLKSFLKRVSISFENKKIDSYHDHSNDLKLGKILELAREKECCFVSDAGSPVVSDPGYMLVKSAIAEGVAVKSYGGVNAPVLALELSGLAPTPFHFHAFLPRDKGKIISTIELMKSTYGTHILFEGVSRAKKTIELIAQNCPDFQIVVARELTKEYESLHRFKGSDYRDEIDKINYKGEFVILVENSLKTSHGHNKELKELAEEILSSGVKPKTLSKLLGNILDINSKEIYKKLNNSK